MRLTEITVPEGCNKIYIDVEDDRLIISYASNPQNREFHLSFTGRMEERPKIGDFAIFWNNGYRELAICSNLKGMKSEGYIGNDGLVYEQAIKFRDYTQYLEVKGVYED